MAAVPKERLNIEEYIEFDKNSEERGCLTGLGIGAR
jgi:hypothetical protein